MSACIAARAGAGWVSLRATMNSIPSIALSGMNAAQTSLAVAGNNIANAATDGFRRQRVAQQADAGGGTSTRVEQAGEPGSSLETDMVGLLESKNAFIANLAVFKTADAMTGSLLDTLG